DGSGGIMRRSIWLSALILVNVCGCGTMNNVTSGAVGGGALGAGSGGLAGAAVGRPLQGAAIGAGVGGLTGAAIGNTEDRAEKRQAQAQAQAQAAYAAAHPPVAINDVVQMTQQHLSEQLIISQIRTTNSYFSLTAADITYLREQGVSESVILEMQNRRGPAPVVVQPRSVVVVDPAPPPPVGVGVGVTYVGGRRW